MDVIVKETGTVVGAIPVALTVIVPLCMPAVSAPVAAVTVTMPLLVPDAGLMVNQLASSFAVQLNVPPPVLPMLNVCVAGLLPAWVAGNERLVGLMPIIGADGVVAGAEGVDTI